MIRQERFAKRNEHVRDLFSALEKKNPKWRIDALIQEVADKVFLSARTVEAIISEEGIYKVAAPTEKTQQLDMFAQE